MRAEARVAVYYAPLPDDPLTGAAACWLGRDPVTNAPVRQPDLPGIVELTADPLGYGFHATLKPPMRLAEGRSWDALLGAAEALGKKAQLDADAADTPPSEWAALLKH